VVTLMRNGYLTFHMPPGSRTGPAMPARRAYIIRLPINPASKPIDVAIRQTTSFSIVANVVHVHDCNTRIYIFILII
jgi:hypothetical protein